MRALVVVIFMLSCVFADPAPSAETQSRPLPAGKATPKRAVARDGWPSTRPGEVGRGWVAAFASGDSAMRDFYLAELSAESLAKRSAAARLETYRSFRERLGTLMFVSVVKSDEKELTVELSDAEAKRHKFVFKVEAAPPHKLESVGMLETRPGGHFHH